MVRLEGERRSLIYAPLPPFPEDVRSQRVVLHTIQYVLDTDQKIIGLCQVNQQELADKIRSLRIGQRARQAYGRAYRYS